MSDDLDRILSDLEQSINELPTPAIGAVLDKWRSRIKSIESQLNFVGQADTPSLTTLKECYKELYAASLFDRGADFKGFKKLLNSDIEIP